MKGKTKTPQHSQPSGKRKTTVNAKEIILITLLLFTPFLILVRTVSSATRNVPTPYPTIQSAVDAATPGDTIYVAQGTYYEQVTINKTVTIIGENPLNTIVDGNGTGSPFYIEDATNVLISGFTIQNAGDNSSGILSERAFAGNSNNRIEKNIIKGALYGITLTGSDNNKIINNTIINNPLAGVLANNSDGSNITGNIIYDSMHGVRIAQSTSTLILNNTITETSNGVDITASSTGTIIRRNRITGISNGVYSSSDSTIIDRNTITNGSVGIYLTGRLAQITYNTITIPHGAGIKFYYTGVTTASHQVQNNKITRADWAIHMTNSYGSTFWGNWIQDNTNFVYLYSSSSNTFYRNNFIRNVQGTFIGATNNWDSGGNGNHWDTHTTPDADGNGIIDTPYQVSANNIDNYPLKYTWSEHDVAVTNVTPSTNQANPGQIVTITVQVRNIANISTTATFTVTAKYNDTVIGTQQVTNLAQGATSNLVFNWDTTGAALGNYTIKAEATVVLDELYTDNNIRTDGTVRITGPLTGDINGDGTINQQDLTLLNQAYGSIPGSPNWNQNADLNNDNAVNEHDLHILGENYGQAN